MLVYNIVKHENHYRDGKLIWGDSDILSCYRTFKQAIHAIEFFNQERARLALGDMRQKDWDYVGIAEAENLMSPYHRKYEFEGKGDEEGKTMIMRLEIESVKLSMI